MDMRDVLAAKIAELMEKDERIVLLDADLAKANGTFKLREKFPERAFDVGISEANMACMAAGMASYGNIPFITSFTPFATRRICDQIAISICYSNQNVKIIGTDPGISAELNGGTHMSVEDIGVLRSIPNIVICEPSDEVELAQMIPAITAHKGPVYLRMFRKGLPKVQADDYKFELFKAQVYKEGSDVVIFTSGLMLAHSIEAAKQLEADGINAEIVNIHTIKPLDEETVIKSALKCGAAIVAENHNVVGGLTSAVSELLIKKARVPFESIGIKDHFGEVGKMPFLLEKYKMTPSDIAAACKEVVSQK